MTDAKKIHVRDLREHLSSYLQQVAAGAAFVVVSRDQPVARLLPPAPRVLRPLGLLRGRIVLAEDFDISDATLIAGMEGEIAPAP